MKSYCRNCNAEIMWLEHVKTGKRAPIDTVADRSGNIIVSLGDGKYRLATENDDPREERFTNHLGTCSAREE